MHRLLAEVVIDAEDILFREGGLKGFVERTCAGEIFAERFLDDEAAHLIRLPGAEPDLREVLRDDVEEVRRGGEVEEVIALKGSGFG